MNPLHLFWIVPLSMALGAAVLVVVACVMVGKQAEEDGCLRHTGVR